MPSVPLRPPSSGWLMLDLWLCLVWAIDVAVVAVLLPHPCHMDTRDRTKKGDGLSLVVVLLE